MSRRILFSAVRLLVVAAGIAWAIAWVSRADRWQGLAEAFSRMDLLPFVAALLIFVGGQFIVAYRWRLLLKTQKIEMDLATAVRLHFLGLFYNNFMPSSVGGDLLRAWYITKHTDKKFEAALSVFVDRIIGLAGTVIIAVVFYAVFLGGDGMALDFGGANWSMNRLGWHGRAICWAVIVAACGLGVTAVSKRGRRLLAGAWMRTRNWVLALARKLTRAIVIYCASPATIVVVFGLTIVMQIAVITGFWFVGRDLGIEAGIEYYYVFFALSWILGVVPISIGGAVIVEGVLAGLFVKFAGVGVAPAVALALSQRIIWMVGSVPGAVIHLLGAHLPKDFSIDYGQKMD